MSALAGEVNVRRLEREAWLADLRSGHLSCHYCGAVATTKDHIVPRAFGSSSCLRNFQPSCAPCNSAKAHRMPTCTCNKCRDALMWWRESCMAHIPVLLRWMLDNFTEAELRLVVAS